MGVFPTRERSHKHIFELLLVYTIFYEKVSTDSPRARVCELLLRGPFGEEKVESLVRMRGKMTAGRGHLRRARAMDERDGEMAQGSQDLRSGPPAETRTIFPKGDIANVVRSVFHAPMAAYQFQEAPRGGLGRSEIGDERDHFLAGAAGLADGERASPFSDVRNQRPVFPVGIPVGAHANGALFFAAPM